MLFRKKKPTYELRLERYWDDHGACEAYRLVKYEIIDGKVQEDGWFWKAGGDKEWAKKQAKHYGLSITTPIFEED